MSANTLSSSLSWSFIEKFVVIGLQFLLEIVMARLLLPSDYGILGMIMVVVAFANVLIDGGISSALIHYKDRTESDYSVVFYFSILMGLVSFFAIFFLAPLISNYYQAEVTNHIRVIALCVLCNSFGILYRAKLSIVMNFKSQTIFSLISIVISGIIGIYLASIGKGVWALIYQLVTYSVLYNLFLFLADRSVPSLSFTKQAYNRIFNFGIKIFLSSVLHAVYFNAFPILLGKFYSPKIVGLYTKSNQITTYPAGLFSTTIQRVLFPYLVDFQEDKRKVYSVNEKFVVLYSIFCFPIIIFAILFAQPIVTFVFSERWIEMVTPFRWLLLASAFFPIIIMNMNIFQIIGKVNMYLYTEIIVKALGIIILITVYKNGFLYVCIGVFVQVLLQFIISSIITNKILSIPIYLQIYDIFKIIFCNIILFLPLYLLQANVSNYLVLVGTAIFCLFIYYFTIKRIFRTEMEFVLNFLSSKIK